MKYLVSIVLVVSMHCSYFVKDVSNKEIVVLLHGFGRSNSVMWRLAGRLEDAGYFVKRVGYHSLTRSIGKIEKEAFQKIDNFLQDKHTKVHFVGHSFGGLLIRSYLDKHKVKQLGNVVLMGTPNKGTEVVDHYKDHWWFSLGGPTAPLLGTKDSKFLKNLKQPYYKLGIIAGDKENKAREAILKGKDDGLVRVESTKVKGMTDFIILPVSHPMLRYDKEVARQTVYFLEHSKFDKSKKKDKTQL
ncbi:MAG: alpha/beta fold hydrolase [Spirochaetota bacterium]